MIGYRFDHWIIIALQAETELYLPKDKGKTFLQGFSIQPATSRPVHGQKL